jgi:hypothetical protein
VVVIPALGLPPAILRLSVVQNQKTKCLAALDIFCFLRPRSSETLGMISRNKKRLGDQGALFF